MHSAVAVLDLRPAPVDMECLERAFSLASHALKRPRKTLPGALAPKMDVADIRSKGIDPGLRPGTLELEDWIRLAG